MVEFDKILKEHAAEDGTIPAKAINAIVAAINTAVGNEFVSKERYKAKLTEIDTLKTQKQTAEDNATTAEKWKTDYDSLKKEYDDYKQTVADEKEMSAKTEAYKGILKDAGITSDKAIAKVLKYSTEVIKGIELVDGKPKDAKDLLKAVKEEWPEQITTEHTEGAALDTPPSGSSEVDYDKMSDAEYYKATYEAQKKGK